MATSLVLNIEDKIPGFWVRRLQFWGFQLKQPHLYKVEIFLEQREVAFLSSSKICKNLNFSREIISILSKVILKCKSKGKQAIWPNSTKFGLHWLHQPKKPVGRIQLLQFFMLSLNFLFRLVGSSPTQGDIFYEIWY